MASNQIFAGREDRVTIVWATVFHERGADGGSIQINWWTNRGLYFYAPLMLNAHRVAALFPIFVSFSSEMIWVDVTPQEMGKRLGVAWHGYILILSVAAKLPQALKPQRTLAKLALNLNRQCSQPRGPEGNRKDFSGARLHYHDRTTTCEGFYGKKADDGAMTEYIQTKGCQHFDQALPSICKEQAEKVVY